MLYLLIIVGLLLLVSLLVNWFARFVLLVVFVFACFGCLIVADWMLLIVLYCAGSLFVLVSGL